MRIAKLFAIERDIKGAPPDERKRVRQITAVPKLEALRVWLESQNRGPSSDSNLAARDHLVSFTRSHSRFRTTWESRRMYDTRSDLSLLSTILFHRSIDTFDFAAASEI